MDLLLRGGDPAAAVAVAITVPAAAAPAPAAAAAATGTATTGRKRTARGGDVPTPSPSPPVPPADPRPECQYGLKCYRKNPQHFQEFKHTGHPNNVPYKADPSTAAAAPPASSSTASPAPLAVAAASAPTAVTAIAPRVPPPSPLTLVVGPPYRNAGLFEFNTEVHQNSKMTPLDQVLNQRKQNQDQVGVRCVVVGPCLRVWCLIVVLACVRAAEPRCSAC